MSSFADVFVPIVVLYRPLDVLTVSRIAHDLVIFEDHPAPQDGADRPALIAKSFERSEISSPRSS